MEDDNNTHTHIPFWDTQTLRILQGLRNTLDVGTMTLDHPLTLKWDCFSALEREILGPPTHLARPTCKTITYSPTCPRDTQPIVIMWFLLSIMLSIAEETKKQQQQYRQQQQQWLLVCWFLFSCSVVFFFDNDVLFGCCFCWLCLWLFVACSWMLGRSFGVRVVALSWLFVWLWGGVSLFVCLFVSFISKIPLVVEYYFWLNLCWVICEKVNEWVHKCWGANLRCC